MFLQRTLRSLDRYLFEALYPTSEIELEIVPQRVLRNVHELRDLPMRQAMTLQPQRFHSSLHERHRMTIALIVQLVENFRGEFQLHGHTRTLPHDFPCVSKSAILPRGQYSYALCRSHCWSVV